MKVAINGFGRIGRCVARIILERYADIELVAINDVANIDVMTYLYKYDSVHGQSAKEVAYTGSTMVIGDKKIAYTSQSDITTIQWGDVDVVIDCTGKFKNRDTASYHLAGGANKVVISAPTDDATITTVVLGVNDHLITSEDTIVSNASCTTNNAAPMVQLIDELCGIESGYITTVHSYTGDQRLHDTPNKDFRRARAAAVSIVPTTTGAAKALNKIFPNLNGKIGGCGIRVPVPDGSLTDFTCIVKSPISVESINAAFKKASAERWPGIVGYTEDPIVSIDIVNNPNSCMFDAQLTSVIGNMVKVVGWYDNEWGYSNRLVELARKVSNL